VFEQVVLAREVLYTVRLDTPAAAAMRSMLVASKPRARNSAMAAVVMAARLRSVSLSGWFIANILHRVVYFSQNRNYTV
jgi:hypothetical protein